MQREQRRSHVASTARFLRLCRTIKLLQERGIPEKVIDDLLREKILGDLAHARAKRLQPSPN